MKRFTSPLRLRSLGGESAHKVTWLELFFDLVFSMSSVPGRRSCRSVRFFPIDWLWV